MEAETVKTSSPSRRDRYRFAFLMAAAVLAGVMLRLYRISEQVLVDDEWHSMAYVIGKPYVWLLQNFAVPNGYTSIPLNLFQAVLLNGIGWSEILMRLPSLGFGVVCLLVGPLLVKPVVGSRRAGTFALLVSISPLLIFYSRLVRPYSAVALFFFIGLLAAEKWMRSGRTRDGIAFAVCGVLAVYSHLFAAVFVAVTGLFVLLSSIPWQRGILRSLRGAPSPWQVVAILAGMGGAGSALILPAFIQSLNLSFFDVAMQGSIPAYSWLRFAELVSGTPHPLLIIIIWGFAVIGVIDLGRRHTRFAILLGSFFPLHVVTMSVLRPHSCQVGIVLARYGITLVPVFLLLAACGLHACIDIAASRAHVNPSLQDAVSVAFAITLALAGPLPGIYVAPNNFTNHGAFQHRYGLMDWSRSFMSEFTPADYPLDTSILMNAVSPFYLMLRESRGIRPIVEYPMMIGDHFNPLYYYQRVHQRPVMVGYVRDKPTMEPLLGRGVYGNTYIDEVLNLVQADSALRFRNLVNMRDLTAMQTRNAEFAVLHKRFEAQLWQVRESPSALSALLAEYRAVLPLVYEDTSIAVFALDP